MANSTNTGLYVRATVLQGKVYIHVGTSAREGTWAFQSDEDPTLDLGSVPISGSRDRAPRQALFSARSLLEILSLLLPRLTRVRAHTLSPRPASRINK